MEITAGQKTLHDLDRNNSEKEDHEDVVCQEMKTDGAQEMTFKKRAIRIGRDIGPEQCDNNAAKKGDGEFSQQIDAFFHSRYLRREYRILTAMLAMDHRNVKQKRRLNAAFLLFSHQRL